MVVNGRSSSSTDRFTPAKLPFSCNVGGQVNSRASLDVVQRRYFFLYPPGNEPQLSGHPACNLVTVLSYAGTRMMQ